MRHILTAAASPNRPSKPRHTTPRQLPTRRATNTAVIAPHYHIRRQPQKPICTAIGAPHHSRARLLRGPCRECAAYQPRCCCWKKGSCRRRSRRAPPKTAAAAAAGAAAVAAGVAAAAAAAAAHAAAAASVTFIYQISIYLTGGRSPLERRASGRCASPADVRRIAGTKPPPPRRHRPSCYEGSAVMSCKGQKPIRPEGEGGGVHRLEFGIQLDDEWRYDQTIVRSRREQCQPCLSFPT